MKKNLIVAALCSALFSSTVFDSPINLPTGIKSHEGLTLGKDLPVDISAGFLYDHVDSRELSDDSGEVNLDMVGGKIILSGMDTVDIYTMLGSAQSPELKVSDSGSNYSLFQKFCNIYQQLCNRSSSKKLEVVRLGMSQNF